jgi:hypothetical protein
VTDPAALEVAFGTAETEISLPAIIEASLTDGATELLTVTWDYPSASYDRNTPGTYTFLGDLALPFGISNPEGLRASIEVAVGLPPLATPVVIVSGNQITWNADELSSGYLVIFTLKSDAAKQVTETVTTAAIIPSDFVSHGTYLITVQSLSGDAGHLNSLPSDPATEYTVYAMLPQYTS